MKALQHTQHIRIICVALLLVILAGCSKEKTPDQPPITTASISSWAAYDITPTTATSGGNIFNDGGATVTARGVCWSTKPAPTTADSKTVDGAGTGDFTSKLAGLAPSTIYYIRAYAVNSVGTSYGNEQLFSTAAPLTAPIVVSIVPSNIRDTIAIVDGNVLSDGGAPVTERGICWNMTGNPTIADKKVVEGAGVGYYTAVINPLKVNVTYHYRAYAKNSVGVSYGSDLSFLTLYVIGQKFQGGRIFYVDETKIHGWIAAENDQSDGVKWDTRTTISATNATSYTDGLTNTTKIITAIGTYGTAARACRYYSGGGYSDWYLPASNQLYKLYEQKAKIGGFKSSKYWSSTESPSYHVYAIPIDLVTGNGGADVKSYIYPVRAIRNF